MQAGVGLGDPGELGLLVGGEVLGVLPERVSGALECCRRAAWPGRGGASDLGSPRRLFRFAARLLDGRRSMLDGVARRARRSPTRPHGTRPRNGLRCGQCSTDRFRDPRCCVSRRMGDPGAPVGTEQHEELVEQLLCHARPLPTTSCRCRDRPRSSDTCDRACRRSRRSRSVSPRRIDRPGHRSRCGSWSMIAPTVRHSIRISSQIADFDVAHANQPTVSSKSRVNPDP